MKDSKGLYRIKTVNNLLDVIEVLASVESIGVTELTVTTGIPKNSVFRLLVNLLDRGYVDQDPVTEKYRLTSRFNELGANISLQQGSRIRTLVAALSEAISDSSIEEEFIEPTL